MGRLLPLLALAVLASCQGLTAESFAPIVEPAPQRHPGFVRVSAEGKAPVSSDALSLALQDAVHRAALFDGLTEAGGDWHLTATVTEFENPEWGIDVHARILVFYRLVREGQGEEEPGEAWSSLVETEAIATPEDAFELGVRADFAISEAVKSNLRQAIRELTELELE